MEAADVICREIVAKPEFVRSAMDIISSADLLRSMLMDKLKGELVVGKHEAWNLVWKVDAWQRWSSIVVDFDSGLPVVFRMEFGRTVFNDVCYGICKRSKDTSVSGRIRESVVEHIGPGEGGADELWPWWRHGSLTDDLIPMDKNWQSSSQSWVSVSEGKLAASILNAIKQFDVALREPELPSSPV